MARIQKERGEERIRALEHQLAEKDSKIAELEATISELGDKRDLLLSTGDSVGEGRTSAIPSRLP